MMMKTQTIAGYEITLEEGINYLATRPMAGAEIVQYPITIQKGWGSFNDSEIVHIIDGLTYDEANGFLAAFNNGESSFDGRNW